MPSWLLFLKSPGQCLESAPHCGAVWLFPPITSGLNIFGRKSTEVMFVYFWLHTVTVCTLMLSLIASLKGGVCQLSPLERYVVSLVIWGHVGGAGGTLRPHSNDLYIHCWSLPEFVITLVNAGYVFFSLHNFPSPSDNLYYCYFLSYSNCPEFGQ